MNKYIKRNITTDYFFRFISSFTICEAIWVLYLGYKGLTLWQIGLLEGVFHATGLLSEIPSGALADILGRKYIIILSRVSGMISAIFMLLSVHMWQFAIGFVFSAWSYNFLSGSEEALLYDSFLFLKKEKDYYQTNSRLSVIMEISQGLATFVGGIIAQYSYTACYIFAFAIAAISLIPCALFIEPGKGVGNNNEYISIRKHFTQSYEVLKHNHQIRAILVYYSLILTFYLSIYFYSQEYFNTLGLNKIKIGMVMLSVCIFSCFGALLSERIHRITGQYAKYLAALVISLGIIGMYLNCMQFSVICLSLMGFCNASLYPLQSASLNQLLPSGQRATILSLSGMAFSVFMIVLFPVIGFLADKLSMNNIFLIIGMMMLGFIFLFYNKERQ